MTAEVRRTSDGATIESTAPGAEAVRGKVTEYGHRLTVTVDIRYDALTPEAAIAAEVNAFDVLLATIDFARGKRDNNPPMFNIP
ncbi:hypothetical protein [Mycobacteroides abscessus]